MSATGTKLATEADSTPSHQELPVTPAKLAVSHAQILRLLSYYTGLVVVAGTVVGFLLFHELNTESASLHLARALAFIVSGALIGSVLYHIRELYSHYLKKEDYDPRWIGKYMSGPWEAAALATVVYSLIRGESAIFTGATTLGGEKAPKIDDFGLFGLGGLIGFGMRDAVGWLASVATHVFPTKSSESDEHSKEQAKKH